MASPIESLVQVSSPSPPQTTFDSTHSPPPPLSSARRNSRASLLRVRTGACLMHTQSPPGNSIPTAFHRKPLPPLTTLLPSFRKKCRNCASSAGTCGAAWYRTVATSSSNRSLRRLQSHSPSMRPSAIPTVRRRSAWRRCRACRSARCCPFFEMFELKVIDSLAGVDAAAGIWSKKSPVAAIASSSCRKSARLRQPPPAAHSNTSNSSKTTFI
jgi:hypothetical protein